MPEAAFANAFSLAVCFFSSGRAAGESPLLLSLPGRPFVVLSSVSVPSVVLLASTTADGRFFVVFALDVADRGFTDSAPTRTSSFWCNSLGR